METTTLFAVITNITDNPIPSALITVDVTARAGQRLRASRKMGFCSNIPL
jgi:hypothetical protein